jgi:WD40 repeat protein
MKTANYLKSLSLTIILTILLGACESAEPIATPANAVIPTYLAEMETAPTPYPSDSTENIPSPTVTEIITPTEIPSPAEPSFEGTPITPASGINLDNLAQLELLALWGKGDANDAALSDDGTLFAVAAPAGVFIFETNTLSEILRISPPFECHHLLFLQDGEHILLGLINGQAAIYHLTDGELAQTFQTDFPADPYLNVIIFSIAADPEKHQLIFSRPINNLLNIRTETWDIHSGERLAIEELPYDLGSTYDPQAQILLISQGLNLTYYNLINDTQTTHEIHAEKGSRLQSDAGNPFLMDTLVIIDEDTILFTTHYAFGVLDLQKHQPVYVIEDFPPRDNGLCKNRPSAKTCIIPGTDPKMRDTGRECGDGPGASNFVGLLVMPEKDLVVFSLNSGTTQGRRISDGTLIWEVKSKLWHKRSSLNQDFFIGLTDTGLLQKRCLSDGTLIEESTPQFYGLLDTAISPDSTILAAAGTDRRLRLLSLADGKPFATFDLPAQTLAFSPDGKILAIGLQNGELRFLSLPDQTFSTPSDRHLDFIYQLAFSEDGSILISGSQDCTARVWDVATHQLIRTLQIIPTEVYVSYPLVINHVGTLPSLCESCYYLSGKESSLLHIYQGENLLYEIDASGSLIYQTTTPNPTFLVFDHETQRLQLKDQAWTVLESGELPSEEPAINSDRTFLLELVPGEINGWRLPNLEKVTTFPLPPNHQYAGYGFHSYREVQISSNGKIIIFAHQRGFIMIFGLK